MSDTSRPLSGWGPIRISGGVGAPSPRAVGGDEQRPRAPQAISASGSVDSALIACAGADSAVFGPVYDALAPLAYGVSLGVLCNPDHATEVTQDVMVEVWQAAARFDPARTSARTWVAMIARRRALDCVRSERSRREREQRDLNTADAGATYDNVAEEVERRLEGASVRRCLSSLTSTQREAIVEAYFGGRTYREVAEKLGTALPTIKTRIRDGLGRLRNCLGVSRD